MQNRNLARQRCDVKCPHALSRWFLVSGSKEKIPITMPKKSQYDFVVGRPMAQLPCEDELQSFI